MLVQDPVLIHQWHPVMLAKELVNKPKAVEVLGEKVVIFRTTDNLHAWKDLCIHRGVPLSLGEVMEDEIVCPYHGWKYNTEGKCTCIPALPKNKAIPIKAKTVTYLCAEKYGLIWICLGEPKEAAPTIGEESLDSPDLVRVVMGPYELDAAGPRIIENFLDVSHLMFVHGGLLGDSEHAEISDYRVHEKGDFLISDEIQVYQPDPDGRGYGVQSTYIYKVFRPLCASFTKKLSEESEDYFDLHLIVLPVNEQKSKAFMIMERNYALNEEEAVFIDFQNTLITQDEVIVQNQKPELLPLDLQAELHLNCDRMSIAYRKMLTNCGLTFGTA